MKGPVRWSGVASFFLAVAASGCLAGPPAPLQHTPTIDELIEAQWAPVWDGRDHVKVADKTVVWHEGDPGLREMSLAAQAAANPCRASFEPDDLYITNVHLSFDSRTQLVWGLTREIRARFGWTPDDYDGDSLALAWKARGKGFQNTDLVPKPAMVVAPVEKDQWDTFGDTSTDWDFGACVSDDQGEMGRMFQGSFHLEMWLVRNETVVIA